MQQFYSLDDNQNEIVVFFSLQKLDYEMDENESYTATVRDSICRILYKRLKFIIEKGYLDFNIIHLELITLC